jgi:hypothetical protein
MVEAQRRTARELNLGRHLPTGFNGFNVRPWTTGEDQLVRTLTAPKVVRRTGRSIDAVYWRRGVLGVSRSWGGEQEG